MSEYMTDEQAVEESYPPLLLMPFLWMFNGLFYLLSHPGCLLMMVVMVVIIGLSMRAGGFIG